MAGNDLVKMRDKVSIELEEMRSVLEKLQSDARGIAEANEQRATIVSNIQALKQEIATKADQYGELARAVSLSSGGANHRPPR